MSLAPEEQRARDEIADAYDRLDAARSRVAYYGHQFAAEKLSQIIDVMDYVLRDFDFREAE